MAVFISEQTASKRDYSCQNYFNTITTPHPAPQPKKDTDNELTKQKPGTIKQISVQQNTPTPRVVSDKNWVHHTSLNVNYSQITSQWDR